MATGLFGAISNKDLDKLRELLSNGADPDQLQPEAPRWRPLQAAIEELEDGGSVEALVLLLRHGASVNAWDAHQDSTPLLMALFRDQPEAVYVLLAAGADPNVVGSEGDSPLRWCVEHRDHAMAATLLRCGAARTVESAGGPSGMTALGRAASLLDVRMMKLLLDAGAQPATRDADRRTAQERLPPRVPENASEWDAAKDLLDSGPPARP